MLGPCSRGTSVSTQPTLVQALMRRADDRAEPRRWVASRLSVISSTQITASGRAGLMTSSARVVTAAPDARTETGSTSSPRRTARGITVCRQRSPGDESTR